MREVVDEDDVVIGRADYEVIKKYGLICRVAFVMLMRQNGDWLLHQRSAAMPAYPLYWSGAAAGHVELDETYADAAHRELWEELGVRTDLTFVGRFLSADDREMVGVFAGTYDGPLNVEGYEVAAVADYSLRDLMERPPAIRITSFVEKALPFVTEWAEARTVDGSD
jgi:isopentenyl-diphosphate delta-isomerase